MTSFPNTEALCHEAEALPHCSGPCDQGRIECPTPEACCVRTHLGSPVRYDRDSASMLRTLVVAVLVVLLCAGAAHLLARMA